MDKGGAGAGPLARIMATFMGQRPIPRRAQPSMGRAGSVQQGRLEAALGVVTAVERIESALPKQSVTVDFWGRGRVVRRPDVTSSVVSLIPTRDRSGWGETDAEVRLLTGRVAADLAVLGKFDTNVRVKLRAAYGEQQRILAVQPPRPNGTNGIESAVRAHAIVSRHAPTLIPRLQGHGHLTPDLPYLVESWLEGPLVATRARLAKVVPEILAGLSAVHRGFGISCVGLLDHWPHLPGRWRDTVATGLVPDHLDRWVSALIARSGELRNSWVHGDVVPSNAVQTASGIALIDWEYAQEAPLMTDGAKLHLFSDAPHDTLAQILVTFGGSPQRTNSYTAAEELALAHANLISQYPQRSMKLVGHPQVDVYEAQIRRQIDRLDQVREFTS